MSYFLFGSLTADISLQEERDELAWNICDAAFRARIFVLLGCNVRQHVALDVLRARSLLADGHLPLLLTRSPLCDTSEELLSDYTAAESEPGSTWNSLNRVGQWLQAVLQAPCVREVHLFTSDGFDDQFTDLEARPDQLADVVMAQIQEDGDVSSLSIRVVPPAV